MYVPVCFSRYIPAGCSCICVLLYPFQALCHAFHNFGHKHCLFFRAALQYGIYFGSTAAFYRFFFVHYDNFRLQCFQEFPVCINPRQPSTAQSCSFLLTCAVP